MKKLNSQSGRSMVEMLGVLAIIGVLSVGGIAGYSLSMRRHRANQVVDLASKYALVAYNYCQQVVLNNNLNFLKNCIETAKYLSFEKADIAPLPAGVRAVNIPYIFDGEGSNSDTVVFSIHFDDDKLCQAVGSIAGKECNSEKAVIFQIKQN